MGGYRTGFAHAQRYSHSTSPQASTDNQQFWTMNGSGMGYPFGDTYQHPAYPQPPMGGELEGAIGKPYSESRLFHRVEDALIEGGKYEATRSKATYCNGAAPVPGQQFDKGPAEMFTRAKRIVIRGARMTAARSITVYDGPAQEAAPQQHSTRYASSHEATPQTVPSGSGVLGGRPAARPGVPDPPRKDRKYTQPQYVYSHTASHTGQGARVRRG